MVEDHKHCVVCGRPVTPDKLFCSQVCENALRRQQRRMSRMRMLMMVAFVAIFILLMALAQFGGGS
jgi:predicted nucleic acid-binding Zn ribbon protein